VPQLVLRVRGIAAGLERGASSAKEVLGDGLAKTVRAVRAAAAFAAGIVLALAVREGESFQPSRLIVAGVVLVLAYAAARLRVPSTVVGAIGAIGALVLMLTVPNGGWLD